MKEIVAIGGGEIRNFETLAIDKEVLRLTNKDNPKLLFIPTASSDNSEYYYAIENLYRNKLGCKTDVLYLLNRTLSFFEIENKILSSDIIYVGGGNTLKMMKLWRLLGVDKLLKNAWEKGIVLCGLSAGSICWFEYGHSDSMSFYNPENWNYIKVKGLGFLKGVNCPHYDSNTLGIPRKEYFISMINKYGGFGIAVDNGAAIEFLDDKYRVINSIEDAGAYKIFKKRAKVEIKKIEKIDGFQLISDLYKID